MPRKSSIISIADQQAAPGGAAAVDRALSLLCAFQVGDTSLSVTELADRTQLYKSTVLRLLASLVHAGFMRKTPEGLWALGSEVSRLAALYNASFSLADVVLPVMNALVAKTGESVALHIKQGDQRLCLYRVDSPQLLRDHVRAGDVLPLDRGAGARVLMAFTGAKGKMYDKIRQDGYIMSVSDRVPGVVGVSAPVWKRREELMGALTLTAPESRFKHRCVDDLRQAASLICDQLR